MKSTRFKRIIALSLALVMMLTLSPVQVLAADADDVAAAKAAIGAGTYLIPVASQTSQETKTAWVQAKVDEYIPAENLTLATVEFSAGDYVVNLELNEETDTVDITVTEEAVVSLLNLTSSGIAPVKGATPAVSITETAQYTGLVAWKNADDTAFVDAEFAPGTVYKAVVTLTAKTGYTLTGVAEDSFTYTGATTVTNSADSGEVTITFLATALQTITASNLTTYVPAPVKAVAPTLSFTGSEYTGSVAWFTVVEGVDTSFEGTLFASATVYKAVVTLTEKAGFTFEDAELTFSHGGADGEPSYNATENKVTITFPATAADAVVNALALDTLVTAPANAVAPDTTAIDEAQYAGSVAWFTEVEGADVAFTGDLFEDDTVYKAVVTLTAKTGYTLTGVAVDSFTYTGATVTNAADSGVVTITFPATAADTVVNALVLDTLVTAPANAVAPDTTAIDEAQYAGSVAWFTEVEGADVAFTGDLFEDDTVYKAVVTFTAKPGYTFTGFAGTFTYTGATVSAFDATAKTVTITFPATAADTVVNALVLDTLVTAPANAVAPDTTAIDETQYTGSVAWFTEVEGADVAFTGDLFEDETVYKAVVTFTAKPGYTFTGFAGTFTYTGATVSAFDATAKTVTITFPATAADTVVNALALDTLVTAPARAETPNTTAIDAEQYTGTVAWFEVNGNVPVTGVFKPDMAYKAVVTLEANPGYTFTGFDGSFTYTGATVTFDAETCEVTITFPATSTNVKGLLLNTDYVQLTGTNKTFTFAAQFEGVVVTPTWEVVSDDPNFVVLGGVLTFTGTADATAVVTATYVENDITYKASATVDYKAYALNSNYTAKLQETKIVVNRKMENGALVPFTLVSAADTVTPGKRAENPVFDRVELTGAEGFAARIYNDSTIEIYSTSTAKTVKAVKNVKVTLYSGAIEVTSPQLISISVSDKLPTYKVTVPSLNLFFPNESVLAVVTSKEGGEVTKATVTGTGLTFEYGFFSLATSATKGSKSVTATVKINGYKEFEAKIKVNVVDAAPKLKLSASSITMNGAGTATIKLLSGNTKVPYGFLNVEGVTLPAGSKLTVDDFDSGSGVLVLKAEEGIASGKYTLTVKFDDTERTVPLTLSVNAKVVNPTFTLAAKSATVNKVQTGDLFSTTFKSNPADAVVDYVTISAAKGSTVPANFVATVENNVLTFTLVDAELGQPANVLAAGTYKLNLKFGYNTEVEGVVTPNDYAKLVPFTLTVTEKAPAMSISLKNKIDIVSPEYAVTATVKLTNVTGAIDEVYLYNQVTAATADAPVESTAYEAVIVNGTTFMVVPKDGTYPTPGTVTKLSVKVVLADGTEIRSWALGTKFTDKPVTITPVQSALKATASTATATLYRDLSTEGERITVKLSNAKLYDVKINEKSVAKFSNYFELVRNGENEWTLQLTAAGRAAAATLKSSYSIKLDVYAVGQVYLEDELVEVGDTPSYFAGDVISAKVKPATLSLKVNIK